MVCNLLVIVSCIYSLLQKEGCDDNESATEETRDKDESGVGTDLGTVPRPPLTPLSTLTEISAGTTSSDVLSALASVGTSAQGNAVHPRESFETDSIK